MNKISMCCGVDVIYLGMNNKNTPIQSYIGNVYNYCCSRCGSLEWSTKKEKCKYKWYKYDKAKLKKLLGLEKVKEK